MEGDLLKFLKSCKTFASLEVKDDIYEALLSQFEKLYIEPGEALFHQGDIPENFYILVNGKLSASFSTGKAKPKIVGYIHPGESVGELGALSNDPRSLDIIAVEKSFLLKLPSDTFKKLCRQYPSILFETVSPLVNRSREVIKALSTSEKKKHIAILPANKDIDLKEFEVHIKETLGHYKKVIILTENNDTNDTNDTKNSVEKRIAEAEATNHVILYLLKSYETPLSKACWEKLSKIYVIGDGDAPPHVCRYTLEKLRNSRYLIEVRRELILLYKHHVTPIYTSKWLALGTFFLHHHIQEKDKHDYQRLLRFMRGKAIGVVLSGGGARGWAHLGALKALIEADIPIDAIGGTSAGAIIGSLYARNKNLKMIHEEFDDLLATTSNVVTWRNLCWPAISLFNCKDFTLEAQSLFQNIQIENLAIPYFCITCNLGLYKEVVHRSGLLWERIRASTAVPGLVPPMIINGDLHIDGGVINNLPVNVMREILGAESKIIAIELISHTLDNKKYYFPPTLTFKEAFLAKLRLGFKSYKFPPFLDMFIKSLLIGSSVKQEENALTADLLIKPHTAKYSMLKVSKKQSEELLRIGYKATIRKLNSWDPKK